MSEQRQISISSCASSSSTNTAITEAAKMLVSQMIDEAVKTLKSTEAVKTLQSTEAEVTDEVNSVLSVAMQASMDLGSSSITAAASCWVSKDRAEKKALEGAITTMKSFLTGQGTAVKRRIQTDQVIDYNSKEETLAGGCEGKRKTSQWKRCFSGWQRKKIQPIPFKPLDEPVRSASTDLTSRKTGESKQGSCCSLKTPSTTSSNASVGANLRSTQLVLSDYVEDEGDTPQDTRNVVSSLSSTSAIPPDNQVICSKFLEESPMAEATTNEFKKEMSTSLTHQSNNKDEETFCQSSVDQYQPDSEHLSNNQVEIEDTKTKESNRFSRFFRNILSKNEKTKRFPFWMRLLGCSPCSCCLDK